VYEPGADPDNKETRAITSGKLKVLSEDLSQRVDPVTGGGRYHRFTVVDGVVTAPGYWTPGAVNLSSLDAGTYDFYLKAGVKAGPDDFEARLLYLECWGAVEPAIQEAA